MRSYRSKTVQCEDILCHILAIIIEISQMLGHEANRKRCPHGSVTSWHGMTLERMGQRINWHMSRSYTLNKTLDLKDWKAIPLIQLGVNHVHERLLFDLSQSQGQISWDIGMGSALTADQLIILISLSLNSFLRLQRELNGQCCISNIQLSNVDM